MRAHYLQHVPFEGLGSIELWLENAGYKISGTRFFDSPLLPEAEDIDFLVIMGGPMSANDEQNYPWLKEEKEFIRKVIGAGRTTLGICLGAQLIACSLGGEVFPAPEKEIGWFPVRAASSLKSKNIFRFPEEIKVFHWHGETFTLPENAVRLAKSALCRNQAFQIGSNVIGLQFHLEVTPPAVRALAKNCREELTEGSYVQSEPSILSAARERYAAINGLMEKILEYLLDKDTR